MAGVENRKYPLYMFDVDFGTLAPPPEPEDEVASAPPPPTFSAEELARARDEGLTAGRAEGIAQSNAGFEHQIAQTLEAVAQTLTTLEEAQRGANDDAAKAAVRLAAAAAAKLMPEYAKQHGLAEIEAFITQSLSNLFEGLAVTVRVPDALAAEIGERIEPVAQRAGFEEKLKIIGDPELGPADCRVEWDDGGTTRNAAGLLAQIDDIVETFLEQPAPPNDTPAPVEDAPAAVEEARDTVPTMTAPAEQNQPANAETDTAEPEPVTTDPPTDHSIAETAVETVNVIDPPPPIIEMPAGEGEMASLPETEPPMTEPIDEDDMPANPTAGVAEPSVKAVEPEKPPLPVSSAGPVLPGAVNIDPAAT